MSKKRALKGVTEEIKLWALNNTAPSDLHTLIQKLNEEIETMDDEGDGDEGDPGDPGGNHPFKKPPIP